MDTKAAEKEWHEQHFKSRRKSELVIPDAIRQRYFYPPKQPLFHLELMFRLAGDVAGKRILVYGCGNDYSAVILAMMGAEVYAFDISEEAIRQQQETALANGVLDRLHAVVCAAEDLPFAEGQFDIIFGSAILHHIPHHLAALPSQLRRAVKPGGIALFAEPTIRSRAFKWLLDKLPFHGEISPGERQLTDDDFAHFAQSFQMQFFYFAFLSRLDRFVLKGPLEFAGTLSRSAIYFFHAVDNLLLNRLGLSRLAGSVVALMQAAPEPQTAALRDTQPALRAQPTQDFAS